MVGQFIFLHIHLKITAKNDIKCKKPIDKG